MSEVTNAHLVSAKTASAASSKGAASTPENRITMANGGNTLPLTTESPTRNVVEHADKSRQAIESAVASMNDFVQSVQRDLRFSIDEELNRTIVKVVDSDSGTLIRQIPEDVFLELARKLKDDGELQLVTAMG